MKKLLMLTVMMFGLAACGGGNDAPPANTPPVDTRVDFGGFVVDEFNLTSEFEEPAAINDIEFKFSEDKTQFDSLL